MAVVPQEAHLAFDYTVLEVALMGRYPHLGAFAIEGPVDVSVAREALAATGAAELESRPFSTLSGGEKQRVIIAAALTQISAGATGAAGSILLLDEPTAALDVGRQQLVLELVDELRRERGLTVVSAMHDLTLAGQFAHRLLLVDGGHVASVASAVGYESEAAFSRAFKKLVGQAPATWRRGAGIPERGAPFTAA